MSRWAFALYGVSALLHVALAMGVSSIKREEKRVATSITMKEAPAKPKPPEPAKVEPPKAEKAEATRPQSRAKATPAAAKSDAPPPPAGRASTGGDALPDFGLSLSGGTGSGGLAVPAGGGGTGSDPAPAAPTAKKVQALAPKPDDDCTESIAKPKPLSTPQASYNDRAREAKVEGKVRIEVQVDERGKVTSARVLSGLGHGLDESALAAARQWTFTPGTRCGKAASSPFVLSMRFVLGT